MRATDVQEYREDLFMKEPFEGSPAVVEQSHTESCCYICRKPISQLEPFGGPGDPLVGDFSGRKLVKSYREEFPGQVGSSWECRHCIVRDGGLWEIEEEDRLGRPLSDDEKRRSRYGFYLEIWEEDLKRKLSESEQVELWVELHDWEPEDWEPEPAYGPRSPVTITLTTEDLREVEDYVHKLQPYRTSR
jgi:hypothetical protein